MFVSPLVFGVTAMKMISAAIVFVLLSVVVCASADACNRKPLRRAFRAAGKVVTFVAPPYGNR